ncbi:MAG: type II secretion system GspH family protein [Methylacidiphilales bacterium]|nr:type II secretion system GspH family protein [Candidatus Methylacidiphilales bacterium]MDW8349201.1 type II secretion system protein [Verrucomicrobiae bacterium]
MNSKQPTVLPKQKFRAFTLVELLVVIAIIGILASLALPGITNAVNEAQMTAAINNLRQLYTIAMQMSLDASTTGSDRIGWPANITNPSPPSNCSAYYRIMQENDYISPREIVRIVVAAGVPVFSGANNATGPVDIPSANNAFRIGFVSDADPGTTIFATTKNKSLPWGTGALTKTAPFGEKGFVFIRKNGEAQKMKKSMATQMVQADTPPTAPNWLD